MCAIAGMFLKRQADGADVAAVNRMLATVTHRGPDEQAALVVGPGVLGAARLAIVATADGHQPFESASGHSSLVFNGEIYNHRSLRLGLEQAGWRFRGESEAEVLAALYEAEGDGFVDRLEGQFALALVDRRSSRLILARDPLGICPLYWAEDQDGLYFCSEAKGLLATGRFGARMAPTALLQMAYFGTICAPTTAFDRIRQLAPASVLSATAGRAEGSRRYWRLAFPRRGEHARMSVTEAVVRLRDKLSQAVDSQLQGEYPPACFLSGGIDSATIAALVARRPSRDLRAFCAASDQRRIDEGGPARATAAQLGIPLQVDCVDEAAIARLFPRMVWHAEVPVISTEAAALMQLAGAVRRHTKIVLTGEGADEAFGGYLAFRQARWLGGLAGPGRAGPRALVRSLLEWHYGSSCLLPPEPRIDAVRDLFGFHPAQAYEWEFYRAVLVPLLAPDYRAMADRDAQWEGFEFDREAVRACHWLDRSLAVAYQVMLPNYLLGAHGDRVLAAQSVEGRYPFLARDVVEFAAHLDPGLKLNGGRDKYVLRRAAEQWLPPAITRRAKSRFVMPFGTPFQGRERQALYAHLLSPDVLAEFGYFDPQRVAELRAALARPPIAGGKARRYLHRLGLGLGMTFVVSTQLWHHLFVLGERAASTGQDPDYTEEERRAAA